MQEETGRVIFRVEGGNVPGGPATAARVFCMPASGSDAAASGSDAAGQHDEPCSSLQLANVPDKEGHATKFAAAQGLKKQSPAEVPAGQTTLDFRSIGSWKYRSNANQQLS